MRQSHTRNVDLLHLVLQDIVGQTQGLAIFVAEQD